MSRSPQMAAELERLMAGAQDEGARFHAKGHAVPSDELVSGDRWSVRDFGAVLRQRR